MAIWSTLVTTTTTTSPSSWNNIMQQLRGRPSPNRTASNVSRTSSLGSVTTPSNSNKMTTEIPFYDGDDNNGLLDFDDERTRERENLLTVSSSNKRNRRHHHHVNDDNNKKGKKKKKEGTIWCWQQHVQHHPVVKNARLRWSLLPQKYKIVWTILLPIVTIWLFVGSLDTLFGGYRTTTTTAMLLDGSYSDYSSFAVVINTYKRPKQLQSAVQHYAELCGRKYGVNDVYIVWAEENVIPPKPDSFFLDAGQQQKKKKKDMNRSNLHVQTVPNSLNSRFLPINKDDESNAATTAAIFMVDDDVRVDCRSLKAGFDAWTSQPDSMVGYYPRLVVPSSSSRRESQHFNDVDLDDDDDERCDYVYHAWIIVYWRQKLNLVLTKAAFLHSKYLELYSDPTIHPQEILDYVDKYFNCEDIAMSMLVANATKNSNNNHIPARPMYVEGRVSDVGHFNGISSGTGHFVRRSQCVHDLNRIYEKHGWGKPLDHIFDLQDSSWYQHVPGWAWQIRPSNLFEWFAVANIFK